jgi:preprotein translocase subunit SecE
MNSVILYVKESYNELLHKVTWPTMPELLSSTTVVLIASVIIALIILVMDVVSKGVLDSIYSLGI